MGKIFGIKLHKEPYYYSEIVYVGKFKEVFKEWERIRNSGRFSITLLK